jgi:GAF domain-containing protein
VGLEEQQTPRDIAFCAHAILQDEPLIVADATKDQRFANNPMVTGEMNVRFYAGFPLINPEGLALGTLCIVDHKPRQLSLAQVKTMRSLARQVMMLLELKRVSTRLAEALDQVKTLQGLLPICAWCKRIRDDKGYWDQIETYFHKHTGADFTHGICPQCLEKAHVEWKRNRSAVETEPMAN